MNIRLPLLMNKKGLAGTSHKKTRFVGTTSSVPKIIQRTAKKAGCPKACGDEEGEAGKWFSGRAGGLVWGWDGLGADASAFAPDILSPPARCVCCTSPDIRDFCKAWLKRILIKI